MSCKYCVAISLRIDQSELMRFRWVAPKWSAHRIISCGRCCQDLFVILPLYSDTVGELCLDDDERPGCDIEGDDLETRDGVTLGGKSLIRLSQTQKQHIQRSHAQTSTANSEHDP
jgi:hypothetical protein